jgi:rhodanese-related sulfurtransferase
MKELSQEEWKSGVESDSGSQIIDVRTQEEIDEGFIPNSIHADIQQPQNFMTKIEELDKSNDYYLYCRSGARSSQAGQIMNQLGFENTFNLKGGFKKWDGKIETS